MVKKLILHLILAFILISPLCFAGKIALGHEGRCGKFNLTFEVSGFEAGSYDLKVEELAANRTLEIHDPQEGWKSSFFYLDDFIKIEGNESESVTVKVRTNTTGNITIKGKLRNGSETWESEEYRIEQICPEKDKKEEPEVQQPPNLTLSYQGQCREYNVTLVAENFDSGLYDVKVNVRSKQSSRSAGRIYDPQEGWKSSYYYVDKALRIVNGSESVTLRIQANTAENITLLGKLRKGSKTWKSETHEVSQSCPEPESLATPVFLLIVLTAVLSLLIGVTYYKKRLE